MKIGNAVMYYAQIVHAFSAGIKCWHCHVPETYFRGNEILITQVPIPNGDHTHVEFPAEARSWHAAGLAVDGDRLRQIHRHV